MFSALFIGEFNSLTAVGALMTLIDFTLSNARRFYSSMGNPLAVKRLTKHDDEGNKNVTNLHSWRWQKVVLHALHVYFSFLNIFADVLVLSTTWNDLFRSCVDDVSIWWQMFNFVCLSLKRWFQFNSRKVRTHFTSIMALKNWTIVAETVSYIFRWRRRRVCLSSLFTSTTPLPVWLSCILPLLTLRSKWKNHRMYICK